MARPLRRGENFQEAGHLFQEFMEGHLGEAEYFRKITDAKVSQIYRRVEKERRGKTRIWLLKIWKIC